MKKLDWYILRKYLGIFVFSLSLILLIVIVFDVSEKIEDFISKKAPLNKIIFVYYLNFLPYFANLFSHLFTFIAVIYFTSRMASRTEIVAMLSNGVSFYRMLYPYFLGATIIAIGSLFLNFYVIPHANKKRLAFEEQYIRNAFMFNDQNVHRQISPGNFIYFERFDIHQKIGYKFSLESFKNEKLFYKLLSDNGQYDTITGKWTINNYVERHILNDNTEIIKRGNKKDTTIAFTPREFNRKIDNIKAMTYSELGDFIEQEQLRGAGSIDSYKIEKYQRIAFPFATYILTLIGVSLSSRKIRGGIGLHLGLGLVISFTFIMFMQISTTFAAGGIISPMIAVWIPNIVFAIGALYLLKRATQ